MTAPRSSLVTTLETAFKNSEVKNRALNSGKKQLKAGRVDRVFDNFPQLIPSTEFKLMQDSFKHIITQIKHITQTEKGHQLADEKNQNVVFAWQQLIAKSGRDALFDEKKEVKEELIELCDWKEHASEIKPLDLLNAYVCSTSQNIVNKDYDFIMKHSDAYHAFMNYANNNYATWNRNLLKEDGFAVEPNPSYTRTMLDFPCKHPIAAIGIFAVVVAGAAAVTHLLTATGEVAGAVMRQ